jgi:hypothetical protein
MPTVHSGGITQFILPILLFRNSGGTIKPVVREIYISRVLTEREMSDAHAAQARGSFFSVIPAKIVATTSSDKRGFYQLELPPGIYSFFVKEDKAFYANSFDGEGRITAFEVLPQAVTKRDINIRYKSYE